MMRHVIPVSTFWILLALSVGAHSASAQCAQIWVQFRNADMVVAGEVTNFRVLPLSSEVVPGDAVGAEVGLMSLRVSEVLASDMAASVEKGDEMTLLIRPDATGRTRRVLRFAPGDTLVLGVERADPSKFAGAFGGTLPELALADAGLARCGSAVVAATGTNLGYLRDKLANPGPARGDSFSGPECFTYQRAGTERVRIPTACKAEDFRCEIVPQFFGEADRVVVGRVLDYQAIDVPEEICTRPFSTSTCGIGDVERAADVGLMTIAVERGLGREASGNLTLLVPADTTQPDRRAPRYAPGRTLILGLGDRPAQLPAPFGATPVLADARLMWSQCGPLALDTAEDVLASVEEAVTDKLQGRGMAAAIAFVLGSLPDPASEFAEQSE